MNSRFKLDDEANTSSRFVNPESLDATEQYFAATLEPTKTSADQRFVVESSHTEQSRAIQQSVDGIENSVIDALEIQSHATFSDLPEPAAAVLPDLTLQQDTDSWRREVAAKVNRYKARKPRPPRYPSLQLKFEPRESSRKDSVRDEPSEFSDSQDYSAHNRQAVAVQHSSVV
ncbi:MAG: hypothetical protein JWO91_3124, partial [Acidobacteriaceae bacterium]|nr:hypothetical protein [Acidobacteriaceae bacterium]